MHLKSVQMHGFKSFADKMQLDFSEGITAIVGPNGSGKSNVADAIRWVLGEQSAKALRGTKMEDVIFSGSDKRKRLSFCAVTLVFDNESGQLDIPHIEVAVERRVYRSGESEYLINGNAVRMKDIHNLFYDTGVGREGYSIIGQGRIEEILSNKGDERRAALEEAAGVMKYKVRRDEAQRKLNNVTQSMLRVGDVIAELSLSLEPLKQQAEEAKEFLELREQLKDLEINIFLEQYERNRERLGNLKQNEAGFDEQIDAARRRSEQAKEEEELANDKLSLFDGLLQKAREKDMEYLSGVHESENTMERAKQRMQYLEAERIRLTDEQARDKQLLSDVEASLAVQSSAPDGLIAQLEARTEELEQRAAAAVKDAEDVEQKLNDAKQQLMDATTGESERKQRIARMEAIISQASERIEEINLQLDVARQEMQQLDEERMTDEAKHAALMQEHTVIERQSVELETQQMELSLQLQQGQEELQQAKAAMEDAKNRLRLQEELQRDYEGFANSVKNLLQDIQSGKVAGGGVHGAVADLVNVPQQYEKAIEQALGGGLQNVVVDREETGKRLIEYLRDKRYGRVTFLPLAALKPRVFTDAEKKQINGSGVLGCALDLIGFDDAIKPAMEYLLGRTVVVEQMDAGIALSRKSNFNLRAVTLQGDIINAGGPMTGGSTREHSLISRERLVQEHRAVLEQATTAHGQMQTQVERLLHAHDEISDKAKEIRQQTFALATQSAGSAERLDAVQYQFEQAQKRYADIEQELERANQTVQSAKDSLPQLTQSVQVDEAALKNDIENYTILLAQRREVRDNANALLAEAREELSGQRSHVSTLEQSRERLERDQARLSRDITQRVGQLAKVQEDLQACTAEYTAAKEQYESISGNNQQNKEALSKLETEREALSMQVRALSFEREEIVEQIQQLMERKYRAQAQMERLEAEFESMQTRIWEEYEISYANALPLRREIKYQQSMQMAEQMRQRMREMDYINPGAIDEYARVSERYEFLVEQTTDLEKAKEDLLQLIDELTEQMKEQFLKQFDIINENFSRIFVQLFKGGQAEMVLSDPDNAMECNIEIVAQPPGTRLQMISLLSGGQRALCAIAILFALLELKATPFCVLDEIDTALDEENLRLLADFLKSYSERTQFIVITHRRATMESASTLYGIAMEEKGVSKLVSVRFGEGGLVS
ncbi:chromosome segregation protein SMC [Eubacteriales bacterium OttesenSCG-928-N14]|nr:chromosome segregation protein SMC [Eubacteriales bacterium OttesenSCG-928-N14]